MLTFLFLNLVERTLTNRLFDIDILIYLLTAIGLTPGGNGTVHIYKQTIHRTTQLTTLVGRLSGIRTQKGKTAYKLLRWSRGSVLAFSTQVHGFKRGRSRRIFKGSKILSTPSLGGEVPGRRFTACKRTLECIVEVGISRHNYRSSFSPTNSSTFRCLELSHLVRRGQTSDGKSGNN